jgi:Flp pilus assembly protein TadD
MEKKMTATTNNPSTTNPSAINQPTSFQPIPTRIRDMRDSQVPPLVVEPAKEQEKAAVVENLTELGLKLAEIHRTAAEAYLSQAMYEESLPHLEAAAKFSPSEIEFNMQLGFVQYITGDDVNAIKTFNDVITADENNGEAWFNLGMVVFGQEQFTEAEFCFSRSCDLESDDAQTWNNRGVCLWKLERLTEARTCFENALKIDATDEDAQFNLMTIGK